MTEVYFDDFTVEHVKSPVVQQDDYYAFGMEFNSFQRENTTKNNYLYNGKEKQDELDLGWLDYGARMYMVDIGRWNTIDPKLEKYINSSPYNYVLNNPLSYIDPTGMEVEAVSGGYKYTGADAQAVFAIIQMAYRGKDDQEKKGRKKNAYVSLIQNKKLRELTNATASKNGHGNWSVFAAKDLAEAANLTSVLPDKSLDNLVFESHAGAGSAYNGLLVDAIAEGQNGNAKNSLLSTELADHLAGKTVDQDANDLLSIMNKVRNKGNFVFAACFLAKGSNGDAMLNSLFELSGKRLNIVGSVDYTRKDKEYLEYPSAATI